MSTTRLLMLGVTRILQPAHGYAIRRELLSWNVDEWASINPGSIYSSLRTLAKEGALSEVPDGEPRGNRPARTSYRLTVDGENEYLRLLRDALWRTNEREPSFLLAGLAFAPSLTRAEVLDALSAREGELRAGIAQAAHAERTGIEGRTMPPHTLEIFRAATGRVRGELDWAVAAQQRIRAGHFAFAGEPGADDGPGEDGRWPAAVPDDSA